MASDQRDTTKTSTPVGWPFDVDCDIEPLDRPRSAGELDAVFEQLMQALEPDVFVEGGAFDAEVSTRLAKRLPHCTVVAYEANPYIYDRFATSRDFDTLGVRYRHAALTESAGHMVPFHIIKSESTSLYDGYHSVLRRTGKDWLGEVDYECVWVPGHSLDDDFRMTSGMTALWLDVEGAAGPVLAGGRKFLNRCVVAKVEVEESSFWQDQWLGPAVVAEFQRNGLIPVARDFEYEGQFNIVFVRPIEAHFDNIEAALDTLRGTEAIAEMLTPPMRDRTRQGRLR